MDFGILNHNFETMMKLDILSLCKVSFFCIALVFIGYLISHFKNISKANADIYDYEIELANLVESCREKITEIDKLDRVFGRGEVYIRYFQKGYGQPACIWKKFIFNRYVVTYEVPIELNPDSSFKAISNPGKGLIYEIVSITKNTDKSYSQEYGKKFFLTRDVIQNLSNGKISLEEFGLNVSTGIIFLQDYGFTLHDL